MGLKVFFQLCQGSQGFFSERQRLGTLGRLWLQSGSDFPETNT